MTWRESKFGEVFKSLCSSFLSPFYSFLSFFTSFSLPLFFSFFLSFPCLAEIYMFVSSRKSFIVNKCMDTKGERWGGMNCEIRIDINTLLILCIK